MTLHSPEFSGQMLRSEKILPRHWERLAVVYVRQSTPQQVLQHQESTRLQYGLRTRATALGWPPERILIIDDDLGKSGSSAVDRLGFQRLVSEVSLDHVGIIFGVEMSRLARSCKDWHQLLEICSLFGTLIADLDGIYDPAQYNDRLLLGLKGTMSEAELHVLKQRMHQGRIQKARRGALHFALPTGYARRPSGEVTFDPDEQVQQVIRLIFRQFESLTTLNAVLRYLVQHNIQMGVRISGGPSKGELEWRAVNRQTLQNLLKNPIYAGAYAYGRRQIDPRRKKAGRPSTGRVVLAPKEWFVLRQDHFPAYISWETYERNLGQLRANQARTAARGVARPGPSLLAGLLICGQCHHRMSIRYPGRSGRHSYCCTNLQSNYGGKPCQFVAGPPLDQFVVKQVLVALAPAALELSLAATEHVEQERAVLTRWWQQRLERAAYEAERAARQYRLVEPENRLVARQLEREWEEKLLAHQQLQEDFTRFEQTRPRLLSPAQRDAIRQLATNIPELWSAPTTTVAERKEILRQVLDQVSIEAQGESEQVQVWMTWAGGQQTTATMIRPVGKLTQLSYYPQLCARIRALATQGCSAEVIAHHLNAEGYRPPKRHETFGCQGVGDLMHRLGLTQRRARATQRQGLAEHEWWIAELAREVGMPDTTLYTWIHKGWIQAHRHEDKPQRWVLWADPQAIEDLRHRHQQPNGYATRKRFVAEAQEHRNLTVQSGIEERKVSHAQTP